MNLAAISAGPNPPKDVHALIEIAQGGEPVKYEVDKQSGALFVDRFLHTAMRYPGNYGFIPQTLADDGDPIDILVVGLTPVVPMSIIRSRPIGVLQMEDEKGVDEKILAVPVDALHPYHADVRTWSDLPTILTEQIAHFFSHYKDLEVGKNTEIGQWAGPEEAERLILRAIERARKT